MSSCYSKREKIAFIHVPKCAGTAISNYLIKVLNYIPISNDHYSIDIQDYSVMVADDYRTLSRSIDPFDYSLVGVIRNPVTWLWSGYNFMKYDINLSVSFEQYIKYVLSPIDFLKKCYSENKTNYELIFSNFYWHCCNLPDSRLPKHAKIFKYEKLYELEDYFKIRLPKKNYIGTEEFPPKSPKLKKITNIEQELIIKLSENYMKKWDYDFNI